MSLSTADRPGPARALALLNRLVAFVIILAFLAMVSSAWLQVISRYFFGYSLGWTEEVAQISLFWVTFMTAAHLAAGRRLMKVDAFLVLAPPRLRLALSALMQLIAALGFAYLAWLGIRLMGLAANQTSTALKIPYSAIYLSLPAGVGILVLHLVIHAVHDARYALRGEVRPNDPTASRDLRDQ